MVPLKHNDYEILDEIREGNHEALGLMFEKYRPLIAKKIHHFNLAYDFEDMLQEGYMIVYKSILRFEPDHNKTFTKYVSLNLDRRYITIVTKRVRRSEIFRENEWYIFEQNHNTAGNSVYFDLYKKEIANVLTKQEYMIYTLRELQNFSIAYIGEKLQVKDKTVYNCLHRAKQKIREHFQSSP